MKKSNIWVEKYRPKNINSIVQQNEIKTLLHHAFETKSLAHLLLYGPPGTGKTTTALTISKFFFTIKKKKKEDNYSNYLLNEKILKERVLELNASDERGIKIVRDKIKNFATSSMNTYENIPYFKIIILDEADAMTSDSQFALRRIIEKYTDMTRFILICNYVTKIIPPLASRCMKLRFQSISNISLEKIINKIAENENIKLNSSFITHLNSIAKGDLRKSINLFERTYFIDKELQIKTLNEVSGQIDSDFMEEIWCNIISDTMDIKKILFLVNKFKNMGYSSLNLLDSIFKKIIEMDIEDKRKAKILIEISNIDYYLNDNASEYIQLLKLFTQIKSNLFC